MGKHEDNHPCIASLQDTKVEGRLFYLLPLPAHFFPCLRGKAVKRQRRTVSPSIHSKNM